MTQTVTITGRASISPTLLAALAGRELRLVQVRRETRRRGWWEFWRWFK